VRFGSRERSGWSCISRSASYCIWKKKIIEMILTTFNDVWVAVNKNEFFKHVFIPEIWKKVTVLAHNSSGFELNSSQCVLKGQHFQRLCNWKVGKLHSTITIPVQINHWGKLFRSLPTGFESV
jgi:hypothetical protein